MFVSSRLKQRSVRKVLYIDVLVVADTEEKCREHVAKVIEEITLFGFLLNDNKSNLDPTQLLTYLGMVWDTVNWQVPVKPDKEIKIGSNAQQ